jgi:hypothetical protein
MKMRQKKRRQRERYRSQEAMWRRKRALQRASLALRVDGSWFSEELAQRAVVQGEPL